MFVVDFASGALGSVVPFPSNEEDPDPENIPGAEVDPEFDSAEGVRPFDEIGGTALTLFLLFPLELSPFPVLTLDPTGLGALEDMGGKASLGLDAPTPDLTGFGALEDIGGKAPLVLEDVPDPNGVGALADIGGNVVLALDAAPDCELFVFVP